MPSSLTSHSGLYGEMEIDGRTSSDIGYYLEKLGDLDGLAHMVSTFNRVTYQHFFDAEATMEINLAKLFPVKKKGKSVEESKVTLTAGFSSLLEINIGNTAPARMKGRDIGTVGDEGSSSEFLGNINVTSSGKGELATSKHCLCKSRIHF